MWDYIHTLIMTRRPEFNSYLIELFIIGSVVYAIMRFLRGTGGEKLFKGIVFLLLGFWVINILTDLEMFHLERIELLLAYFMIVVLVVSAVAFQPELRRGLMQLGVTKFGRSSTLVEADMIEQIVDSANFLSKTQIGAIIAFEREVKLVDFVQSGTVIQATVSSELINTIFWPGSPLHDMAVIVRQNRIAAAGVQFPLAEHGEFDRNLGSRHRAAIGVSKSTDALVLVVSEETGQISLALNGKLNRFLTLEQLRQQLLDILIPADTNNKAVT